MLRSDKECNVCVCTRARAGCGMVCVQKFGEEESMDQFKVANKAGEKKAVIKEKPK